MNFQARRCVCVRVWSGLVPAIHTPEQDVRTNRLPSAVIMAILPHDDALGYLVIWANQAIYSQLSSTPPFTAIVWKSICVVILTVHFLHCHYTRTLAHSPTHNRCHTPHTLQHTQPLHSCLRWRNLIYAYFHMIYFISIIKPNPKKKKMQNDRLLLLPLTMPGIVYPPLLARQRRFFLIFI